MKKHILLVLLFNVVHGFSQNQNAVITYKKSISKIEFNKKKKTRKNVSNVIVDLIKEDIDKISYELQIKGKESFFSLNKILTTEDNESALKLASSLGDSSGEFYMNLQSKVAIRSTELLGERFNIITSLDSIKWDLTGIQKKIGNYKCYKATTKKIVKNSKGIFNHNVEAWYAPEIPFGFGPVGFGGLPGLIIEIQYRNVRFYVSKIELYTTKDFKEMKPTKGVKVTKEEYNEIVKNMANGFLKSLKN